MMCEALGRQDGHSFVCHFEKPMRGYAEYKVSAMSSPSQDLLSEHAHPLDCKAPQCLLCGSLHNAGRMLLTYIYKQMQL
ncbi:hypothetical protein L596_029946 [Steinernema carpocapsae]|uniref:Uncharacterized protein n=1 Tax=Steinernema carpocapsae TaxID=34508 RepID=A0A4U5LRA8_STECR|nr:hypothetical protein L596_029946 [Steinernema carpocapsae]